MTVRYDEPNLVARAGNELIRWLAEAGISVAGTVALRVRGRKTGKLRGVVINLLNVDGRVRGVAARKYAVGAQREGSGCHRDGSAVAHSARSRSPRCPMMPSRSCSAAISIVGSGRLRVTSAG